MELDFYLELSAIGLFQLRKALGSSAKSRELE